MSSLLLLTTLPGLQATQTLRFEPKGESGLTKTVTTVQYLSLESYAFRIDEREQETTRDFEVTTTQSLQVTDEYGPVTDGRPATLRRVYDRLSYDGVAELAVPGQVADTRPIHGGSPLQGKSVVFTWVDEEQSYGKYFDLEETDEQFLAELEEDMDFRAFLPSGPVKEDDSWTVDAALMRDVLGHGGDLGILINFQTDPTIERLLSSGVGGAFSQLLAGKIEGEVKAVYGGLREEEGAQLGIIRFEFRLNTDVDQTEKARRAMSSRELPPGSKMTYFGTQCALENGKGELLWDMAAGRAHSFSLRCDERLVHRENYTVPSPMKSAESEIDLVLSGQVNIEARFGL